MASQTEKTEERVALEEQAKALGMKGIHFCKTEESLKAAIAKKQADGVEEPTEKVETIEKTDKVTESKMEDEVEVEIRNIKRKTAPRMSVDNIGNDDRTALINRMEREDPDSKYLFQNGNVTARELKAKGLERTSLSVKNDILCRTLKEGYDGYISDKNQAQHESMQRIDPSSDGIVGTFDSKAKKPPK